MKVPTDPDEIIALLSDLTLHLRNGLETGTIEVREHFARNAERFGHPVGIDKTIANNLMRYETLMHMHEVRPLNAPYQIENVPLNGLSFRFDWCHVKVYKSFKGEPPPAHNTQANRTFYRYNTTTAQVAAKHQPKLRGIAWRTGWRHIDWEKIAPTLDRGHFIYCWEADSQYSITRTQLVAPREPGKYKQVVRTFFRKDIQHPILDLSGIPSVNDIEEVDDLPLQLEDEVQHGDDD